MRLIDHVDGSEEQFIHLALYTKGFPEEKISVKKEGADFFIEVSLPNEEKLSMVFRSEKDLNPKSIDNIVSQFIFSTLLTVLSK